MSADWRFPWVTSCGECQSSVGSTASGSVRRPALGALDRGPPPGMGRVGLLAVAVRLELAVERPGLLELVGRGPDARAEPGREGGAEAGGLDDPRPLDGYSELVGLQLAQQV